MRYTIIVLIAILLFSCNSQSAKIRGIDIANLKFESIFGTLDSESKITYSILGTGFFRTPRSNNSDTLINLWFSKFPNAKLYPVSSFGPVKIDEPESKFIYSWIIADSDTLNIYLIKNGCFPGGTMMRPNTWDEMEKWEKELYDEDDEMSNVQIHVSDEEYNKFLNSIEKAENYAKENQLGIWGENFKKH